MVFELFSLFIWIPTRKDILSKKNRKHILITSYSMNFLMPCAVYYPYHLSVMTHQKFLTYQGKPDQVRGLR
jgi:hypothetical protein